jgi:hypothetical protein
MDVAVDGFYRKKIELKDLVGGDVRVWQGRVHEMNNPDDG